MTATRQEKPAKKAELAAVRKMIAELILEAEPSGNTAEIYRRENIAPNLFYRWQQKALVRMVAGLKQAFYRQFFDNS